MWFGEKRLDWQHIDESVQIGTEGDDICVYHSCPLKKKKLQQKC